MIRKLKRKFIVLALTALFVLLAVIVVGMNLLNYRSVVKEADATLELLSKKRGNFPEIRGNRPDWLPRGMSPEIAFESRFFSVLIGSDGTVLNANLTQIYMIGSETAVDYAQKVLDDGKDKGFVGVYRYNRISEGDYTRITFLDCGRKIDLIHDFITFSIGMALLGYAVTALVICIVAGRFVRPVAESYDRQKRFITDAGHEIKTPLTIIRANVDVLQMDLGENNESLEDIRQQSERLSGLTNDLVYLAKMEESQGTLPMTDFPVSEIVAETSLPFRTLAQSQKKELELQIQPMLSMKGNAKAFSRLVSILIDNAVKYSPEESRINLTLEKQGRHIQLTVANPSVMPVKQEDLKHVFERFYRMDSSRNSETGGHGIGLSMAQAIAEEHNGKISASTPDGSTFVVTASFPI